MEYLNIFFIWIMNECYSFCQNFGMAIILFTLCSKIILLPMSLWTYMNSITMIKMQPDINNLKVRYYGQKDMIAEEQAMLFRKNRYHPLASVVPLIIQLVMLMGVVGAVQACIDDPRINMSFGRMNLGQIPDQEGIKLIWLPIVAGISAWILCLVQNAANVLQAEQSKYNKYGTMIFSVGLSLYLGWYVPAGTALYWICSNIMAVIQLYVFNGIVKPQKYVDYEKLEESREALDRIQNIGRKKEYLFSENKSRERKDYKRFFSVVNKHLVFYSEGSGFYKYYEGMIEYLIKHTDLTIHYITGDPEDRVFDLEKRNSQIRVYYISENRLITLMMKMDADIVIMTMPDLDNYHIKRSYVRKDIEYIYVPHGMGSINLTMRTAAVDHFDTVFCTGKHQKEEIEKVEEAYHLPKKRLVEFGYPLLDKMRENYRLLEKEHTVKTVLIAPSWQEHSIMDSCLVTLLDSLKSKGYQIIVRPHPQYIRCQKDNIEQLKSQFEKDVQIKIQTDFSSNSTVFDADIIITDWSDIAYEYAYTTYRPVLFIDTPMKIMNPEYKKIDIEPVNIWMREKIGLVLTPEDAGNAATVIEKLLSSVEEFHDKIDEIVNEYVYHPGISSEVGAQYIISRLQKKVEERKKGKK